MFVVVRLDLILISFVGVVTKLGNASSLLQQMFLNNIYIKVWQCVFEFMRAVTSNSCTKTFNLANLIENALFLKRFFHLGCALLKIIFNFLLGPGGSGGGSDCHFPKEIIVVGPIPARIRGYSIFILALSTARSSHIHDQT